ncbi:MAG: HEAT repeat domain-containing protein [Nitrospirae bacterium]|nr:HEAT repeat domain-containing protein [Nitrospirota bacterium]
MAMSEEREKLPPDARLLCETITDLNISRRNVSIYPRGHPAVERSLKRAFDSFRKLLGLKPELVLAVAKDSLIFDDFPLDKKNPVYREFALALSRMNVVTVTFLSGLTMDELYEFHMLLSGSSKDPSSYALLQEAVQRAKFIHIKIGLIDYGAFSFSEGKTEEASSEGHLWERYVCGLLEGTLQTEEASEVVQDVPSEDLARFLNNALTDSLMEGAYDRVVNTFMGKMPGKAFSLKGIRKLMELINGLRPELKREFLASAVKTLSGDIPATEKALGELPLDKALELLKLMNEQKLDLPEQLENLFDKFSRFHQEGIDDRFFSGNVIMDDIVLSPDVEGSLGRDMSEPEGDEEYENEIRNLLHTDVPEALSEELEELKEECSDEHIEKDFNETILAFLLPESTSEEDCEYFLSLLKQQADHFLWTGQYGEALRNMRALDGNIAENRFVNRTCGTLRYYKSPEFISRLVDSLRIMGRQAREEAVLLCEYYGREVISPLIDALIEEESQAVRRFFLSLIAHFGESAVPEAVKRLGDSRWFVKRNMIFIMSECGGKEALSHIRPYCHHENPKISVEAMKCLLKAGDSYGISALKDHLKSETKERVEQAITLSGSFRVREVIPDLIRLLKKREVSSMDFHEKIPIVRALGQIGDPAALVALRDILSTKSLLFKGAVEKLREEIYAILKNFPPEDVRDLVEEGMKSRNEQIRRAALQMKSRR